MAALSSMKIIKSNDQLSELKFGGPIIQGVMYYYVDPGIIKDSGYNLYIFLDDNHGTICEGYKKAEDSSDLKDFNFKRSIDEIKHQIVFTSDETVEKEYAKDMPGMNLGGICVVKQNHLYYHLLAMINYNFQQG